MMRFVLSAGILAAMMGAAEAAPKCSPGKIYRVSKKVCVDKAEAVRDGIISNRAKASSARKSASLAMLDPSRSERAKAQRTNDERTAEPLVTESVAPAREVRTADENAAPRARPAITPRPESVAKSTTSPFGALAEPWSSGPVNLSPETRFSLQMTSGDQDRKAPRRWRPRVPHDARERRNALRR